MLKKDVKEQRVLQTSTSGLSLDVVFESIKKENVITGSSGHFLYYQLKKSMMDAKELDIIVSFLMESGVRLLIPDLRNVIKRGGKVRILTGSYLNITQPSALYLLKGEFGDSIDLRFYSNSHKSFHTKAYIFRSESGGEMYIGSSNISKGALTDSVEWNYRFDEKVHKQDFELFCNTFEELFQQESIPVTEQVLYEYSKNWKKPTIAKNIAIYSEDMQEEGTNTTIESKKEILPRGAQLEALYYLQLARKEGYDRGLVVAATGIGKTYLAAFDSIQNERILFVAHREEILIQAMKSFQRVRGDLQCGFFYGEKKEIDKPVVFALVQTLGKEEYLTSEYFEPDFFQYIVIDEFHHAVARNYQNVLKYFKPEFLLGLTATPERMDSGDVFALCDDNIVYELRLKEAINKGWLVPFRYFGVFDDTVDYRKISYRSGRYNEKELEEALSMAKRAELILAHYSKYISERALGFCCSKVHAYYMAKFFTTHGIPSAAVYSEDKKQAHQEENIFMDRTQAVEKLRKGELKIIFSVDMFNEGLDIKEVDLLLFLRPTQSSTVFLQQLGRGLRLCGNKKYVTVLDFIGNYKNANHIPFLLSGESYKASVCQTRKLEQYDFPVDCFVDFDLKVIDLFRMQAEQKLGFKQIVLQEYEKMKNELGHRPSRTEFVTYMDDNLFQQIYNKGKLNPLTDYLSFLAEQEDATTEELKLLHSDAYRFIHMIEVTKMSKSYKMPLLLAFYNEGRMKASVNADDIYRSFHSFYKVGANRVDMIRDKNTSKYDTWNIDKYVKLAIDNPIHFMLESHGDIFESGKSEGALLKIRDEFTKWFENEEFCNQVKDAIDCRSVGYCRRRSR